MRALEMALRVQAARTNVTGVKARKWPRPKYPTNERLYYYRQLLHVLETVQYLARRDLLPALPAILGAHNAQRPEARSDAADTDIDAAFEALGGAAARAIPEPSITLAVQQAALRTSKWNAGELTKQVQQVAKINLFDDTTGLAGHLDLFVADNVRLVKSLADDHLAALKGIVTRGARQGLHHSEVADQIEARFGVAKRRAALIASDQIGKLNGELNQLRQQNIGVRRYRWSSSQDERVRSRHRVLNGTIQTWKDPPVVDERTGERGHPGQPIRCRCSAIPIIDDVLVDAGLMDPADVELTQPTPGRQPSLRPVPLPPGPLPPEPPPAPPPVQPPPPLPPMPPAVPQPPPANVSATSLPKAPGPTKPQPRASAPTPPKPPAAPVPKSPPTELPPVSTSVPRPPPANVPPGGGGGGGGGGGQRPPGGGDGPPNEPLRTATLDALRGGFGSLPANGGHAPEVRGAAQSLLEGHYGLSRAGGQDAAARERLDVVEDTREDMQFPDGRIRLRRTIVQQIKSALSKLKRGAMVTADEADALSTMIHEELHGMGPEQAKGTYRDAGWLIEEVTTTTLARTTTRHLIGRKALGTFRAHHPLRFPQAGPDLSRPYDSELVAVLEELRSISGRQAVQPLLEAASFEVKRGAGTLMTPEAHAHAFAAAVPGLSPKQREALVKRLIVRGRTMYRSP